MISDKHFRQGAYTAALLLVSYIAYQSVLIEPMQKSRRGLQKQVTEAQESMRADGAELRELQALQEAEEKTVSETRLAQRIERSSPKRPWVEFPTIFKETLEKHEVEVVYSNLSMMLPFKGAPDFVLQTWLVRAPGAPAFGFSSAIAELEDRFPLAQIDNLSMTAVPDGRVDATASFQVGVKR